MATNTAGAQGQEFHQNMVHYVSGIVVFGDDDLVVTFGKIPPTAVVIRVGCVVTTAFSANSVMDIGTSADPDAFASALVMTTAGHITDLSTDPHIANDDYSGTADLSLVASLTSSGSITAGRAVVYATYIIPSPRPNY